jgi:hypothetical protein
MKPDSRSRAIVEHRLRTATPSPGRRGLADLAGTQANEPAKLEVWAPLFGFDWNGSERKLGFDTKVVEGSRFRHYDAPAVAQFLSEEERDECRHTRHWLWFTQSAHSPLSLGGNANAFLLALWIARPSPTYMRVRFHHNDFGDHGATRILDRFTWIGDQVSESLRDEDLDVVGRVVPNVRTCYQDTTRLRSALSLTVRACTAHDWQVAFVSFTMALTTLLRHSGRGPLIARLGDAYSALVPKATAKGFPNTSDFTRLHRIGTQIFLGRAHELRDREENIRHLQLMANATRAVWSRLFESSRLRSSLEASDTERAKLFS